ncbi:MAG: TRAP transporter small permease [Ramlibacter sp.]|nr:TRAP transporter small permease [Ramlibacter sp.]
MKHTRWRGIIGGIAAGSEATAGLTMLFMMLLTGADIVGRLIGRPIPGTYELVSFAGGVIAGLAMPATALARAHVVVDLMTANLSARASRWVQRATRATGIAVLGVMTWGIVGVGNDLRGSGEVSAVLALPFYPVAYGMACAFFVSALAMLAAGAAAGSGRDE